MMRSRLIGLLATVGLLGFVFGVPLALTAFAPNPLPGQWPGWDQLWGALTSPDDGTLVLNVLVVAGWVTWAVLTVLIVMEAASQLRGVRAPRLPALGGAQALTRAVVAAAVLLVAAGPVMATASPSGVDDRSSGQFTATPSATLMVEDENQPEEDQAEEVVEDRATDELETEELTETEPAEVVHVTRPGDTLWRLAEQYLGDGLRYPEIAEANRDQIAHPDFLDVGWELKIPGVQATADEAVEQVSTHTVQSGETLSQIAKDHLGEAEQWPLIFEASQSIVQPDGAQLSDPDLIRPGWTLNIPHPVAEQTPTRVQGEGEAEAEAEAVATFVEEDPATAAADEEASDQGGFVPETEGMEAELGAGEGTSSVAPEPAGEAEGGSEAAAPPADSAAAVMMDGPSQVDAGSDAGGESSSWALAGLLGAGLLGAGGIALLLRRRRQAQFRHRQPGRITAAPDPDLVNVERTVLRAEQMHAPPVESVDAALRLLAQQQNQVGEQMPVLAALSVEASTLTAHLAEPVNLPPGWVALSEDHRRWQTDLTMIEMTEPLADQPPPYPLLVTVGVEGTGKWWLLNLETWGVVRISGDPASGTDFIRYITMELATQPWGQHAQLHCVGTGAEAAAANPSRVAVHPGVGVVRRVIEETSEHAGFADEQEQSSSTSRVEDAGGEVWAARLLVLDAAEDIDTAELGELIALIDANPERSGTAVVLAGGEADLDLEDPLEVHLDSAGRVSLPSAGLELQAVGLTATEAAGVAALLEQAMVTTDEPVPVSEDAEGWRSYSDQAGALRQEYTTPRATSGGEAESRSLLPEPDAEYLDGAAATSEDLSLLAPGVSAEVGDEVLESDPSLDEELAMWHERDCPLPRVSLLGQVQARTNGDPKAVVERKAYYTELLAYLATHPGGVTGDQLAEAMDQKIARVRVAITTLRAWLGRNPRTGEAHLPDARRSPAAQARGVGVYQVLDVLVDADLFRRLRLRGQARGGEAGMADLRAALGLVTGQPLSHLRPQGWGWVLEGNRMDRELTVAVADVAHVVVTASLRENNLARARAAAEIAALAAPDEDMPQLDLAAVAEAEGHSQAAEEIRSGLATMVVDGEEAPRDLSERTKRLIRTRAS